jgi:hypothetical protein
LVGESLSGRNRMLMGFLLVNLIGIALQRCRTEGRAFDRVARSPGAPHGALSIKL